MQLGKGLCTRRMPPRQVGEINPSNVNIVEIAVIKLVQLMQRPTIAELLAAVEYELVQQTLLRLVRGGRGGCQDKGKIQHGKFLRQAGIGKSEPLQKPGRVSDRAIAASGSQSDRPSMWVCPSISWGVLSTVLCSMLHCSNARRRGRHAGGDHNGFAALNFDR